MSQSRLKPFGAFLFGVLGLCSTLWANSASPYPVDVQQPTGERVTLFLRGTEKLNWYEFVPEAADMTRAMLEVPENMQRAQRPGYTVVRDEAGRYVYAILDDNGEWVPSDRVVSEDPPEDVPRRLLPAPEALQRMSIRRLPESGFPSRAASPMGSVKNLVILLRFADHQGRALPSREDVDTLFNSPGGHSSLAPTGSVRDFYLENSYAKMSLDSTVVGWVTLPRTEAYYANGTSGTDLRVRQAMTDALNIVRQQNLVNFADFDNENGGVGDGWIDSITFVHSGYAAEFGGVAGGADYRDRIWSHSYAGSALPPIQQISASAREMSFLFGDGSDEKPPEPSDSVFAGLVQVHAPTSHAASFSPDGKAASLLFDRLFAEASDSEHVGTTVATFTLPIKPGTDSARVSVDVRGFASVVEGTSAFLAIQGMGNTVLVDLGKAQAVSANSANPEMERTLREPLRSAWKSFEAAADDDADVSDRDFHERLEWSLTGEKKFTITFLLVAGKLMDSSYGAFLAIDSLDVQIEP